MRRWAVAAVAILAATTATAGVARLVGTDGDRTVAATRTLAPVVPSSSTTSLATDVAATTTTTAAEPTTSATTGAATTTSAHPRPSPSPSVTVPASRLPADALRDAVRVWLSSHPEIPGGVVGVAETGGGGGLWVEDVDVNAPSPPDRDDVYGVLSITKTFTEALVLREAAAGRIDLDAPMPPLPGVDVPAGIVITPRMLLQHTSGLVDYTVATGYNPSAPITPVQIVNLVLRTPLQFSPGTKAAYSRSNSHWLGLLLEHVTGRSFADLVAGLAAETGLTHTSLGAPPHPGWVGYASGGVTSTVAEIARWAAALLTPGRVLDPKSLSLLTTVGPLGVTHGLWPACPCDGGRPTALAQVVHNGGLVYLPTRGAVVVVHLELGSTDAAGPAVDLATVVDGVLAGH